MQTTIQVEKDTLNKLETFKEYNMESYNEVINKLMKFKEISELKLAEQTKKDIDEARKEKGIPLRDAIKELGVEIEL
jgi:predicted Holliday junction resolvase-like endonuclease